jgi:hypothetical protein
MTDGKDTSLSATGARPEKKARGPIMFMRKPRKQTQPLGVAFAAASSVSSKRRSQFLKAGSARKSLVHVTNRAARFPPAGTWPIEMRAETVAAYLDFATTRALCKAVARGEAPAPNATRGVGESLEVVWYATAVEDFVARRNCAALKRIVQ